MALLLTLATGAWAQDPDPIDLTPSADAPSTSRPVPTVRCGHSARCPNTTSSWK